MPAQGPFCQSCAMPMEKPKMFGTQTDGSESEDYCTYCFRNGRFTEPDISMEEMIDRCASIMEQHKIMPEKQARDLMAKTIPALKRWQRSCFMDRNSRVNPRRHRKDNET
jgi:hypothetical protein